VTVPRFAMLDGQLTPYGETRVGLLTHALNYGTGAFAGIRAYWNAEAEQLFLFRPFDHVRRLRESARLLRKEVGDSDDNLVGRLVELLLAEGLRQDTYVRGLAFYRDEVVGVRLHGLTPSLAFVAIPFGRYIENIGGAHLGTSGWRRVRDDVIPPRGKIVGAYVNSALAKSDAELAGFDEALLLDEDGRVSEGTGENVFMLRRGTLVTPPVSSSILEGITRSSVLRLAQDELELPVCERPIDRTELYLADEVFMTGTAAQITAVTRIDHRAIANGELGPQTARLQALFDRVVRGGEPRYREWCHPVYAHATAEIAAGLVTG